jgi:D-alanine-D-alanine ligase
MNESPEVIIESAIVGTEISNGVFKTRNGGGQVLPITEVVSEDEFFDYDAKYNGKVKEITPARLSESTTKRVQALTSAIYDILGATGIIRIDYIISKEETEGRTVEKINLLEVNTTPGMTATSFIPQQAEAAGLKMTDVLTAVIEDKIS